MTPLQSFDSQLITDITIRGLVGPVREISASINSSSATCAKLALFLGVEIQQDVTFEDTGLQAAGPSHTGLLIISDKGLQRTMLQSLVLKDRKREGHTDAVIRAEGRPFGGDPLTLDLCLDRVSEEVMLCVGGLLRNHVHVGLHDHTFTVLITRSGGFREYNVASVVTLYVDTIVLAPLEQIFLNFLLVLRRTGNPCKAIEILPNGLWL